MYLITKKWRKDNWEQFLETSRRLNSKYRKTDNAIKLSETQRTSSQTFTRIEIELSTV